MDYNLPDPSAAPGTTAGNRWNPQRKAVETGGPPTVSNQGSNNSGLARPGVYQTQDLTGLPTIWVTFWITLFFGVFGLIPATIHTNQAQQAGRPTNQYWRAFGWGLAATVVVWILLLVILGAAAASVSRY